MTTFLNKPHEWYFIKNLFKYKSSPPKTKKGIFLINNGIKIHKTQLLHFEKLPSVYHFPFKIKVFLIILKKWISWIINSRREMFSQQKKDD